VAGWPICCDQQQKILCSDSAIRSRTIHGLIHWPVIQAVCSQHAALELPTRLTSLLLAWPPVATTRPPPWFALCINAAQIWPPNRTEACSFLLAVTLCDHSRSSNEYGWNGRKRRAAFRSAHVWPAGSNGARQPASRPCLEHGRCDSGCGVLAVLATPTHSYPQVILIVIATGCCCCCCCCLSVQGHSVAELFVQRWGPEALLPFALTGADVSSSSVDVAGKGTVQLLRPETRDAVRPSC
jgi:hypothetical protein